MAQTSVLLVGHDASRTGAPMVQLSILRWLVGQGVPVRTVLLEGGPMLGEFAAAAPCLVLASRWSRAELTLRAGLSSVGVPVPPARPPRRVRRHGGDATVVVANTLAALPSAQLLARAGAAAARLVCHVHELDGVADRLLPPEPSARRRLLGGVDRFIAAGAPVAAMLTDRLGVAPGRVVVVDEFIDRPAPNGSGPSSTSELRAGDRPLVLDVGAMHRRKGPERFVDLLTLLAGLERPPVGVWLGGTPSSSVWAETEADVARSAAPDAIRLVPNVEDPVRYLRMADVVVSTAIEDPYPLAVLEAAAASVPVVMFDSGGAVEVLRGAGWDRGVVGVGDLLAMRDVVADLLDDAELRSRVGGDMQRWVLGTHLTEHLAPRWWQAVVG